MMLTNETTERIKFLINKIINSWNLSSINIRISIDHFDLSKFEYSRIEENKKMWEDIAKLSINLNIDYEYYRQFCFKSRYTLKEYSVRLLKLGFVLENDCWKSVHKPESKDVETNIFMYFLYRIISEKMSSNRCYAPNNKIEKQQSRVEEELNKTVDRCLYCDNEILSSETKCLVCEATIDKLIYSKKSNEDISDKWKCDQCGFFNEGLFSVCGACSGFIIEAECDINNKCGERRTDNNAQDDGHFVVANRDFGNVDGEGYKYWIKNEANIKKWSCGGCELLNEYSVVTCVVCYGLYKDGRWICERCKADNCGKDDRCSRCNERNVNSIAGDGMSGVDRNLSIKKSIEKVDDKSDIVGRDKETHIPVDEWRCVCKTRKSYKYSVCEVCGRDRDVSGEWMCAKCKTINKCDINRCITCYECNGNLSIKLCQYCKKNRVTGTDIRCEDCTKNRNMPWKCGYSKCGIMNSGSDEYCCKCYFWLCNTYGRGDESKRNDGKINFGWICGKCCTFNELSKVICDKNRCKETRYAKVVCDHCHTSNDPLSNFCLYCGRQLR